MMFFSDITNIEFTKSVYRNIGPFLIVAKGLNPDQVIQFLFPSQGEQYQRVARLLREGVEKARKPKTNGTDIVDQLRKLSEMHTYQQISDEEYEKAKKRLLE